jgi:ribonuclease HI
MKYTITFTRAAGLDYKPTEELQGNECIVESDSEPTVEQMHKAWEDKTGTVNWPWN